MIKRLFSHSFLYAIGPQVPKIANIAVLPIITQFLTPIDYGIYGTILAYSGLIGGLKMLGFEVLLVNSFFKKINWIDYWGRYFTGLYVYNVFFSFLYIFILYYLMPEEVGTSKWLVILLVVIPSTFFNIVSVFGSRYYQLVQKPAYIAIATSLVGIVTILLNLYTIAVLKLGYLGWFISSAIGTLLSFVLYVIPLIQKIKLKLVLTKNKNFWRKSLKVALPTIPHNYSTYLLHSSDRLVMDQLKVPVSQIGVYNLAYIFGGYMEFFGNAIGMAVGPVITGLYAKKTSDSEKQVKSLIFFLQIAFILGCALVSLWSKELFHLLIKQEELSLAYPISIIIIMGFSYRPLYWCTINKLIFYEKTGQLWKVSFIAGAINIILNLIFIPIYGITAAALTTLISLIYLGLSPFYLKEYRKLNNEKYYPIFWMLIIILLTIFVYLMKDSSLIMKIGISGVFVTLILLYFFKEKDKLSKIEI